MRIAQTTLGIRNRQFTLHLDYGGDDMNRSSLFVQGFLAGAGLVIAGLAGIAALARGARSWRRVPDAPNYAYLR
jgi:hypothetical protein